MPTSDEISRSRLLQIAPTPLAILPLPNRWAALYLILAVLVCSADWVVLPRLMANGGAVMPVWYSLMLAVLHALVALALADALMAFKVECARAYRGAVLVSAALAVAFYVLTQTNAPLSLNLPSLLLAETGCLFGGLAATMLREGFMENNFPPDEAIKNDVLRRHSEVIGCPPGLMRSKRVFDIALALMGILVTLPLWVLFSLLIWIEAPGAVVFIKNSVGLGGKNFHQYKFRTMVHDAERETGPVLASPQDDRLLRIGVFLRRMALDELPQLVNILKGEMSFVGPRPQRTVLVHGYLKDIPAYAERHRVPPGLSGLAQVAGSYYLSPGEKLKWDRLYFERASLKFDLRLLALAFVLVFWKRWREGDGAELPRRWLGLD